MPRTHRCLRRLAGLGAAALPGSLVVPLLAAGLSAARAELPPQYTVWSEFGAIAGQADIPGLVGVVEAIERVGFGKYRVRGSDGCSVEVTVTRKASVDQGGRPMPGPSRVDKVTVGERRCK